MSIISAIKKPVQIEAIQYTGNNISEIEKWSGNKVYFDGYSQKMEVDTLEGTMTASVKDYIIRGVDGEYYPCKPDIFIKTYDIVSA